MSEKDHSTREERQGRCFWGLYVILDRQIAGMPHVEIAKRVIAGGARAVQLRDKSASFEELLDVGRELRELTRQAGVTLIVNDNPYLAREVDADGVHIGQGDFPAYIVRDVMGPDKIIGLSTHTKQQAIISQTLPVDYIGVGPIYPTTSKKSEYGQVGTPLLRWVSQQVPLPTVAIGGISEDTIPDVVAAGADNVAVIREIMGAENIEEKTRRLVDAYRRAAED